MCGHGVLRARCARDARGGRARRRERAAWNARNGCANDANDARESDARGTRTDDGTNAARSRDAACPKRHKMEAEAMFPGVDVGDMLVVPTRQVRGRTTTRATTTRATTTTDGGPRVVIARSIADEDGFGADRGKRGHRKGFLSRALRRLCETRDGRASRGWVLVRLHRSVQRACR